MQITAAKPIFVALLGLVMAAPASATWPERPVRLVTLAGPGGSSDTAARIVADALGRRWQQPVIVDNKPGADGIVAVETFLATRDDGHTLLFANMGTYSVNALLHDNLPYDPRRDLLPVSFVVEDFMAIVATRSLPADSLASLVAAAKAKPATLNYTTVPGMPYLAFLALQKSAGAALTFIPYRNPIGAVPDLINGGIDVAVLPLGTVLGQIRAGQLKALAVTNSGRPPSAPEVPSLAEAGYPGFAFAGGLGLFAPKQMPAAQRERIAADVRAIVAEAATAKRLGELSYRPRGTDPQTFLTLLEEQSARAKQMAGPHGARPNE